jgi:hypothetical protein
VPLLYCVSSVFCFCIYFILLLRSPVFLTLGASFHVTSHKEWFSEYQNNDGGDFFLGYDLKTKIMGRGRVKLLMKYRSIRTIPRFMPIRYLSRSLISVSKLDDAGVDNLLVKETCNMVRE